MELNHGGGVDAPKTFLQMLCPPTTKFPRRIIYNHLKPWICFDTTFGD